MKNTIINLIFPIIIVLLVLLIWQVAAIIIDVDLILPSVGKSFKSLFNFLKNKEFYLNILYTIYRLILSFIISFLIALIIGIISSLNKYIKKAFDIIISIIRSIPTMSILLILIISFNPSNTPILVSLIVVFPILYSSISDSLSNIDKNILEMTKVYNIDKYKIIKYIYIPSLIKSLKESLPSTFNLNLKLIIAAEALSITRFGIGSMMNEEKVWLNVDNLFALTIVAIILGVFFEYILRLITKKMVWWENDKDK